MKTKSVLIAVFTATLLLEGSRVMAQDSTPAPAAVASPAATTSGTAPADRFAEFRQRMNDRLKTMLKASDDEWTIIQPLLDKVETQLTVQRASLGGRFGAGGGGGGRRGGGPGGNNGGGGAPGGGNPDAQANRPNRFSSPEVDALRTVLDSDSSSVDDIKTKLQALRDARKKATADLEQSREDLKKVLTLRQEAVLVEMGVLD